MNQRRLGLGARVYAWVVVLSGAAVGAALLSADAGPAWDWQPILLFGLLAVAAAAFCFSYHESFRNGTAHMIGTSFAYALFLLADPGAVCLVLWVMASADWAINRRRPLTAAFNMAQLSLSLGAAFLVRQALFPGFTTLDRVDPWTLGAAVASLVTFSLSSTLLTQVVVNLANRRPWLDLNLVNRIGVLTEVLCIVSGLGMSVLWWARPWLVLLGIAPIWLLLFLLFLLGRREQELRSREQELRSLQGLGLEIGAELDVERLPSAVVRIAGDALQASGGLLAVLDGAGENLVLQAHTGVHPEPPARVPLRRFSDGFFETGTIRRITDFRRERDVYPELSFLEASGVLCAPLEILGRREGMLVLFHGERRLPFDADDVRRLETLVRFVNVALSNAELVAETRRMQEQLVQSEKLSALGMLVSGVSHELNNPLTSVIGFAELLVAREDDPDKRRMIDRVLGQSRRAVKIVQNLLTFSRKHKPEKRLVDVNSLIADILELQEHSFRVRNVEMVRRQAPELPPVLVDPHQFQQVFLNLLTNAEQAVRGEEGGGRIVVQTSTEDGRVRVVVSDNGPGIPPEHLDQVFLPFFTTRRLGHGTGLGLSICYGIVKEHGGRIAAASPPGGGAVFTVEIPIAEECAEAPAVRVEPALPGPDGRRLLVVDDEEAIVELVVTYLGSRGWTVTAAKTAEEALELVAHDDFDVLLVDLLMPGMGGRAFYDELRRARPELAERVVFATGAAAEVAGGFLAAAEHPVLDKPFDLQALARTVIQVAGDSGQVH